MSGSIPFHWRSALAAMGSLAAISGCAHPLIEDGVIREGPMREIVANTVRARAIEPEGSIAARSVNRDELRAILAEELGQWKTPAELADYQRALVALGLWPAGRELLAEALAIYAEAVVGVYLPAREELLLVSDADAPRGLAFLSAALRRDSQTEFALSHEIIHLLQHQAYPELMDPDQLPTDSDDLETAIQAALEGDAIRFGFDAVGRQAPAPSDWTAMVDGLNSAPKGSALADAPALIRLTLGFPYARGYALAWNEEFRLLESPPISTEQVMHDDRRREAFWQIDLAELEDRLPLGCRTLQRNTAGELLISVLFRDLSQSPDPALWQGWNGDRYLVADCAGRTEWVWWTAWDSESDAAEFADAYRELAPAVAARAGSAVPAATRTHATYVVVTSGGFAREASQPPPPATRVADLATLKALLRSGEKRAVSE
ncbi:MAG: hypothetical protein JRF15_09590 [Deltaproteobacteria bacterium]|jgi:hypothetical protein|nr:hypothetical protein [Deltaproteobacteria bacterium]